MAATSGVMLHDGERLFQSARADQVGIVVQEQDVLVGREAHDGVARDDVALRRGLSHHPRLRGHRWRQIERVGHRHVARVVDHDHFGEQVAEKVQRGKATQQRLLPVSRRDAHGQRECSRMAIRTRFFVNGKRRPRRSRPRHVAHGLERVSASAHPQGRIAEQRASARRQAPPDREAARPGRCAHG